MSASAQNWVGGIPGVAVVKHSTCQCRRYKRCGFIPWVRKIPWSKKWQPILVFLSGKFHGQRTLVGYSPWDCKESVMTEWLCSYTPRGDIEFGHGTITPVTGLSTPPLVPLSIQCIYFPYRNQNGLLKNIIQGEKGHVDPDGWWAGGMKWESSVDTDTPPGVK